MFRVFNKNLNRFNDETKIEKIKANVY